MAYIGNTPADKYQTLEKQSFSVSATTGYTLSYSVSSPQDIALFINNVRQNPNSSYTVSNTALTLSSATSSSDVMYAVFLGKSVGTIAPASNSVTSSMLVDNSVTDAKLDSYEEGSFTPTLTANSVTYDNQRGRYTKVGNKVFVDCLLQWNSASFASATAALTINGLPFTPINIHYHGSYGTAYISSVNTNNVDSVAVLYVISTATSSSSVNLIVCNNDASGSKIKNDNNGNGVISFCITYRTTE